MYLKTPTFRQAIRGRANTRPIAPKHHRSTKPCELPLQSRTRTPNVEKHCPRLVAQGHHLRIPSACDVPSLKIFKPVWQIEYLSQVLRTVKKYGSMLGLGIRILLGVREWWWGWWERVLRRERCRRSCDVNIGYLVVQL